MDKIQPQSNTVDSGEGADRVDDESYAVPALHRSPHVFRDGASDDLSVIQSVVPPCRARFRLRGDADVFFSSARCRLGSPAGPQPMAYDSARYRLP